MSETLFVSDIHLDTSRASIIDLFNAFLTRRATQADALYILGDLFEYWVGDDAHNDEYASTLNALKQLTDQKVPVYFLHGNRDFLIAERFARLTGVSLLQEETVITPYQQRILLMHGDTLCTDDVAYQNFRKKTHNRFLQKVVLSLPIFARQVIAGRLRATSRQAIGQKPPEIMDVNQSAVDAAVQRNNAATLIHGHTHRSAIHNFTIGSSDYTRVVLGDWYFHGNVFCLSEQGMRPEDFTAVR